MVIHAERGHRLRSPGFGAVKVSGAFMRAKLKSQISRGTLLLTLGALGGCSLHDDARLSVTRAHDPVSQHAALDAYAAANVVPGPTGAANQQKRNPAVPPKSNARKQPKPAERDPELERKLAALQANPEARESMALRGGFIIPAIAVIAIILGLLAPTNPQPNPHSLAGIATQETQTKMSLQTNIGLPGGDVANGEQRGNVRNEASQGYSNSITGLQQLAVPGESSGRPTSP